MPPPVRSWCPTCALPVAALLVQLLHVVSYVPGSARPSVCGAGEDVVHVRRVARAVEHRTLLVDRIHLVDLIAILDYVTVEVRDVRRRSRPLRVVPRSRTDAVARVDLRLSVGPRPRSGTRARCGRARRRAPERPPAALHHASAPASPPRLAPSPFPALEMKNVIGAAGCCGAPGAGAGFWARAEPARVPTMSTARARSDRTRMGPVSV